MTDYALSQLMQKIERMIMVATVTEVSGDKAKVQWADGVTSDWLKISQLGSEALKFWIPPTPGTQVVVLSPGGNTAHGIIYPGPFAGGVPAGNFVGAITGAGTVTVDGEVTASGIALTTHAHGSVAPGSGQTGEPI